MSRRWRRELARQAVRDEADRARLEALIVAALAEDSRRTPTSPRDARGYEGSKKDEKGASPRPNV